MKIQIILIGAGQLGSRHLQGLLKLTDIELTIYVVDPSVESQTIAKQRAEEITHSHATHYISDFNTLPNFFDIAIIATNANIREKITIELLTNFQIKYLILEKVLFQNLNAYSVIDSLIEKQNVLTWVNHPRRMFNSYIELKQKLKKASPKTYQITGGNWGLGCNGLHFIDLLLFLSDSTLQSIDAEWVDNEVLESKRQGFVEFTGTIKGRLNDESIFQITSIKGDPSAVTLTIFDTNERYVIQEGGTPKMYEMSKENIFKLIQKDFTIEYQSSLTTMVVNQLLKTGNCNLPTFKEAADPHKQFISILLNKYNTLTGNTINDLPIT